jgi:hypothetical protein
MPTIKLDFDLSESQKEKIYSEIKKSAQKRITDEFKKVAKKKLDELDTIIFRVSELKKEISDKITHLDAQCEAIFGRISANQVGLDNVYKDILKLKNKFKGF